MNLNEEKMAWVLERLEGEPLREAVSLLVRPLQARALLAWASGEDLPSLPEWALPEPVIDRTWQIIKQPSPTRTVPIREPAVSFPWNNGRLVKVLRDIPPGKWKRDPDNHKARVMRPLELVVFNNGLHSGAVGILRQEGRVEAHESHSVALFEAGLSVEWADENALARLGGERYPFKYPEWGLVWWAAYTLWKLGKEVK